MLRLCEAPSGYLGKPVRVFRDAESFLRHVQKHILGKEEGAAWAGLFPVHERAWSRLAGASPDEALAGPLQPIYDAVAERVATGIAFAETQPLVVQIVDAIHTWDGTRLRRTTWFLAAEGFLIAVCGGIVRTVFMDENCGTPDNRWALFAHGVSVLRKRGLAAEQRARRHLPEENAWATGRSVTWHVRENFTNGCNPWPKPARPRPRRTPEETGGRAAFLAHVGTYFP